MIVIGIQILKKRGEDFLERANTTMVTPTWELGKAPVGCSAPCWIACIIFWKRYPFVGTALSDTSK